jgi:hypothetical protein
VVYPHNGILLKNYKEQMIVMHYSINESSNNYVEAARANHIHITWFHLYNFLKNGKSFIVAKSWSIWRGGYEDTIQGDGHAHFVIVMIDGFTKVDIR